MNECQKIILMFVNKHDGWLCEIMKAIPFFNKEQQNHLSQQHKEANQIVPAGLY